MNKARNTGHRLMHLESKTNTCMYLAMREEFGCTWALTSVVNVYRCNLMWCVGVAKEVVVMSWSWQGSRWCSHCALCLFGPLLPSKSQGRRTQVPPTRLSASMRAANTEPPHDPP